MKRTSGYLLLLAVLLAAAPLRGEVGRSERTITMEEYLGKVRSAWIGKMAGVGWGITTEFRYSHRIVPDSLMPAWHPGRVNEGFNQDDLYLSVAALRGIDKYGTDITAKQAAIERYNYDFEYGGRNHFIREGVAPPDLGHPEYKKTPDGCGYTCGSDFSGIIAPGLPQSAVKYAGVFGTASCYGDGLYGGMFIGAMYSEAFFTRDMHRIIEAGLRAIPDESYLAMAVRDVVRWHKQNPADWKATWQKVMDKYWWNPEYNWLDWAYGGGNKGINLDSKSMAAFTVMCLLYGGGDPMRTLEIGVQSSEDSDCNASLAGGILFASLGMDAVPATFCEALDRNAMFKYMPQNFEGLMELTEQVARDVIPSLGGRIEKDAAGRETIIVPAKTPDNRKQPYISTKNPGPLTGTRFTEEELAGLELIADPGFENQSQAWSFFCGNRSNHIMPVETKLDFERYADGRARTGIANAAVVSKFTNGYHRAKHDPVFAGVRQTVGVEPGEAYRLSCAVQTQGGRLDGRGRLSVKTLDGTTVAETVFGNSPEWSEVSLRFENGPNEFLTIECGYYPANNAANECRFDDFSMRINTE